MKDSSKDSSKKRRHFTRHGVGIASVAVAALAASAISTLPPTPEVSITASEQVAAGSDLPAMLTCAGGFERSLDEGMNVTDVEENISTYFTGVADESGVATAALADDVSELPSTFKAGADNPEVVQGHSHESESETSGSLESSEATPGQEEQSSDTAEQTDSQPAEGDQATEGEQPTEGDTDADHTADDHAEEEPDPRAGAGLPSFYSASVASPQAAPRATLSLPTSTKPLAGAAMYYASAGDTRGTASLPCLRPASDFWLVGSRADVGTLSDLVVANPGSDGVAVSLEAYGPTGALDLGLNASVSVPGNSVVRVPLSSSLPTARSLAIHVYAKTGLITAALQESVLDGATPAGITFVTPASAAKNLWIPGVAIAGQGAPSVRIVNPHEKAVKVHLATMSRSGYQALSGAEEVSVPARSVLDLSLAGLEDDVYAVHVASEEDVVAGALMASRAGEKEDIAWAHATPALEHGAVVFHSEVGAKPVVSVVSDSDGEVQLKVYPVDAAGTLLEAFPAKVSGRTLVNFELPDGATAAILEASAPVHAAAVTTSPVDEGNGIDWAGFELSRSFNAISTVVVGY